MPSLSKAAALLKEFLDTRLTPVITTGARKIAEEPLHGFAGTLRETVETVGHADRAAAIPLKNFIPDAEGRIEFTADQVVVNPMNRHASLVPYSRYKRSIIDKINPHIGRPKTPVGIDLPPAAGADHGTRWAAAEISDAEFGYQVELPDGSIRQERAHWTRDRSEINIRSRALDRPLPAGTVQTPNGIPERDEPRYQRLVTVKTGLLGLKKRTVVVDDETFLKVQARAIEDYMRKGAGKGLAAEESTRWEPPAMVLAPDKPFSHLPPDYLKSLKDETGAGGVYFPQGDVSTTTRGEAWKAPSRPFSSDMTVSKPEDGSTPWSHYPPGEFSSTRMRADPNHSENPPDGI
ncbi:hypothetical protein [Nocardia sp. NPDC057440]|uniref:hypothetical protein n=1 Tax=Nocardia sp. NPDC057440 TaxID=3346134 RepID=UPI0036717C94